MKYTAGVDIGNATTEVCLASISDGQLRFLSSASVPTTGIKGTANNVIGVLSALEQAANMAEITTKHLDIIRINEAAPVIGGAAIQAITETIVTESSMLGHDPKTPAGYGTAVGETILLEHLSHADTGKPYIVVVHGAYGFETAAQQINQYEHINITGAILAQDEAVLVYNRLHKKIPIIDEVKGITHIKEGVRAAIEVALSGQTIQMLSNPYGIATLLSLTPFETECVIPISKSLIGNKSAVVMKAPWKPSASQPSKKIGNITLIGETTTTIDLTNGAQAIMHALSQMDDLSDATGDADTKIGDIVENARSHMTAQAYVRIKDIFAIDTFCPVQISGNLAGETYLEKAVAIAIMVHAGTLPMQEIAKQLSEKTGVYTIVSGTEPVMASLGALTTPGASLPLAMLDLGGGSTDAAIIDANGTISSASLAGAGNLVTLLIQSQLSLTSDITAENIKKYPAAKVESLFHIRLETGEIVFYEQGLDPRFFGSVVLLSPEGLIKIEEDLPLEKLVNVRKDAKSAVFVKNAERALLKLSHASGIEQIKNIILVGGSAEDFEIPNMISEYFAQSSIVCGRGNIRGICGARNAVATGLVMDYFSGGIDQHA